MQIGTFKRDFSHFSAGNVHFKAKWGEEVMLSNKVSHLD